MKIDPLPRQPPALDPNSERYWNARDLENETRRTFEVCHNWRMCAGYCGTFPDVFGRVDRDIEERGATRAELLHAAAFSRASKLCWQAKMCYIQYPSTKDESN